MRTWGRVLRAIREDEDAAASLGKNAFAYKLQSLALGSALGGVAGVFYAWQFSYFSPDDFQPLLTFFAWMIVILGGLGRVWAVPVGALVFGFLFAGTRFLDFAPLSYLDSAERAYVRLMRDRPRDHRPHRAAPQGSSGRRDEMVSRVTRRSRRGRGAGFGSVRASTARGSRRARSITGLIGPNGAGKSTLFNCISGFRPQAGVSARRRSGSTAAPRTGSRGQVSSAPSRRRGRWRRMTVLENVVLAAPRHPGERLGLAPAGRGREREAQARAAELLELVRLSDHAGALAGTLSGGQRKLLDLVRALMAEPRILLLDEPMAGVSPSLRGELLEHILDLRRRDGITLLIV